MPKRFWGWVAGRDKSCRVVGNLDIILFQYSSNGCDLRKLKPVFVSKISVLVSSLMTVSDRRLAIMSYID